MPDVKFLIALPLLLIAGLTLAGCEREGPNTQRYFLHPGGTEDFLRAVSVKGPVSILRQGTPYPGQDAELEALIVKRFTEGQQKVPLRFHFGPAAAPDDTRIVLAFQPPDNRTSVALCEGEQLGRSAPGKFVVLAAVCVGTQRLAEVKGWTLKETTLDDPDLPQLLGQLIRELVAPAEQ